jgi:type II secretory pathway component PulF
VLERVAQFKQRAAALRGRIVGALIYPAIVLLVGVGVSIFLMTFVVPNLLEALLEADRPLPLATRLVKGTSDLLLGYGWLLPIAAVLIGLGAAAVRRSQRGRWWSDRLLLRLPLIGPMLVKQEVMRLAVVMSTLLRSGVEFVRALQIAQHTSRNVIVRQALVRCEQAVGAGREIADALAGSEVFNPMVIQIFAVGQQSGRLEEMLERLAQDHDQQLQTAGQRLTAVLEPVLILALAALVGLIAFATLMPILEAGNVL